jgi:hypothetical protein
MNRLFKLAFFFTLIGGLYAGALLPVTPYTVVAKVVTFEHYRAFGSNARFSQATPYGNDDTVVAVILQPASLAGREIAIPFESKKDGKELLVQTGTIFRFEYYMNLADLRARTDQVRRRAIEFPAQGVIVLKASGEVGETYAGRLSPLLAASAPTTGGTKR